MLPNKPSAPNAIISMETRSSGDEWPAWVKYERVPAPQ